MVRNINFTFIAPLISKRFVSQIKSSHVSQGQYGHVYELGDLLIKRGIPRVVPNEEINT